MSKSPELREPTDEALAESAQTGCAQSFEELMRRYQPGLLGFLRMRTSVDAEDLLQETFLRAFRGLANYRRGQPLRPWLFAIARHASIDASRGRSTSRHVDTVEDLAGSEPQPHERLAREEDRTELWSLARAVLSDEEWTALWLHYAEGMPTVEIGAVLRRSRPAVKTMLCRARKKLAAHLARTDEASALSTPGEKLKV